jgi:hypothetical protein
MPRHTILAVLVVGSLAAACGGPETVETVPAITDDRVEVVIDTLPTTTTTETAEDSPRVVIGAFDTLPPIGERNLAGLASTPLEVFDGPFGQTVVRTLPATTILGTPTVVRILGEGGPRYEVALPGRPNGATGWVDRDDLELFPALRSIEVDLSDRRLVVKEEDEIIFTTQVGVGSPSSPTPTGSFFITDAVIIHASSGPWGPFAFGLSARSNTVTEFNGGDGIIGIHGTNRPRSIGSAQSLGCVRLPNEMITELFELVGVGTPVEISS